MKLARILILNISRNCFLSERKRHLLFYFRLPNFFLMIPPLTTTAARSKLSRYSFQIEPIFEFLNDHRYTLMVHTHLGACGKWEKIERCNLVNIFDANQKRSNLFLMGKHQNARQLLSIDNFFAIAIACSKVFIIILKETLHHGMQEMICGNIT